MPHVVQDMVLTDEGMSLYEYMSRGLILIIVVLVLVICSALISFLERKISVYIQAGHVFLHTANVNVVQSLLHRLCK